MKLMKPTQTKTRSKFIQLCSSLTYPMKNNGEKTELIKVSFRGKRKRKKTWKVPTRGYQIQDVDDTCINTKYGANCTTEIIRQCYTKKASSGERPDGRDGGKGSDARGHTVVWWKQKKSPLSSSKKDMLEITYDGDQRKSKASGYFTVKLMPKKWTSSRLDSEGNVTNMDLLTSPDRPLYDPTSRLHTPQTSTGDESLPLPDEINEDTWVMVHEKNEKEIISENRRSADLFDIAEVIGPPAAADEYQASGDEDGNEGSMDDTPPQDNKPITLQQLDEKNNKYAILGLSETQHFRGEQNTDREGYVPPSYLLTIGNYLLLALVVVRVVWKWTEKQTLVEEVRHNPVILPLVGINLDDIRDYLVEPGYLASQPITILPTQPTTIIVIPPSIDFVVIFLIAAGLLINYQRKNPSPPHQSDSNSPEYKELSQPFQNSTISNTDPGEGTAKGIEGQQQVFVSARFLGDETERQARELCQELCKLGVSMFMVDAGAGETFGNQVNAGLTNMVVLLAICSSNYGEKTQSSYCTYRELEHAFQHNIPVFPLKLCDSWPPHPPKDYDGGNKGWEQNNVVFKKDLIYCEWSEKKWDAAECAEEVKSGLEKMGKCPLLDRRSSIF